MLLREEAVAADYTGAAQAEGDRAVGEHAQQGGQPREDQRLEDDRQSQFIAQHRVPQGSSNTFQQLARFYDCALNSVASNSTADSIVAELR